MPVARPSQSFLAWLTQACTPVEQSSVAAMVQDLNRYGLAVNDPDLVKLARGHPLGGTAGLQIHVYLMPESITISLGRTRRMWFGIVEVSAGPAPMIGRLLVLKAWTADPKLQLVAVENELIALARVEYP